MKNQRLPCRIFYEVAFVSYDFVVPLNAVQCTALPNHFYEIFLISCLLICTTKYVGQKKRIPFPTGLEELFWVSQQLAILHTPSDVNIKYL